VETAAEKAGEPELAVAVCQLGAAAEGRSRTRRSRWRGLSVPDIEDAFKEESGRLPLWRTAVSELGARLWED
jgi:hypothetical protein